LFTGHHGTTFPEARTACLRHVISNSELLLGWACFEFYLSSSLEKEVRTMMPKTFTSSNMSILPFETFRTFGPLFDKHWPTTAWTPPCDIYESDKEVVLKMELPDMRKEDVHVTFENSVLTVRGERKFEGAVNPECYHRIERKYGEFIRIFSLPGER
jgi:HSP20 family molecular chaperone IbpA